MSDKEYTFFEIENYKTSKACNLVRDNLKNCNITLIFLPYFVFSSYEKEGNEELINCILILICSLPGKHVISMFSDLRCVDSETVANAYTSLVKRLGKLNDDCLCMDDYIAICQTSNSLSRDLNAEIYLAQKKIKTI